jgi:hypothetical protein
MLIRTSPDHKVVLIKVALANHRRLDRDAPARWC